MPLKMMRACSLCCLAVVAAHPPSPALSLLLERQSWGRVHEWKGGRGGPLPIPSAQPEPLLAVA